MIRASHVEATAAIITPGVIGEGRVLRATNRIETETITIVIRGVIREAVIARHNQKPINIAARLDILNLVVAVACDFNTCIAALHATVVKKRDLAC